MWSDKIREVDDASHTFELIADEWLQMKNQAEIILTGSLKFVGELAKSPSHHFISFPVGSRDA